MREISKRGALMGLPGTKIILHTLSKAIDVHATQRQALKPYQLRAHPWRCAGDDVVKFGNLDVLDRYYTSATTYRVKPSVDKWGTYLKGGKFCERPLRLDGYLTTSSEDLKHSVYQDMVPMRLLSPETKAFSGDEDTNPIFGKGFQLGKELQWYTGPPSKRDLACVIFRENFKEYGNYQLLEMLPREFGGFGLIRPEKDLIPEPIRKAIALTSNDNRTERKRGHRLLALLRRPLLLERGNPKSLTIKENPMEELFASFLPFEETEKVSSVEGILNLKYSHKVAALRRKGYVSIDDILSRTGTTSFWEAAESKIQKGWNTATLGDRVESLRKSIRDSDSSEGWEHALENPTHPPAPLWVKEEYLNILADGQVLPLNLMKRTTGLSLSMRIPNRTLFEDAAWEERNFSPPRKRMRHA